MQEMTTGKVAYAALSLDRLVGLDEPLHPMPWNALKLDAISKRFTLNVETECLKDAPRFAKDD